MPKSVEQEPTHGKPGECGFWPDDIPSEEVEPPPPPDLIEVYGPTPTIVLGEPFERIPGTIKIGTQKTVELPPEIRVPITVIEMGPDGEFHERPATTSEIGGGLQIAPLEKIDPQIKPDIKRTHQKSSRRVTIA